MRLSYWRDLVGMQPGEVFLLDARTQHEFMLGAIPGAINIPVDELRDRLHEIPTDKPVIVYCAIGLRGNLAGRILMQHGFKDVRNLSGGYKTYVAATAPIVIHQ